MLKWLARGTDLRVDSRKKSVRTRKMKLQGTKSVSSRHRFTCRFFKKQNLTRKAYFIDHEQGNDMLHQH